MNSVHLVRAFEGRIGRREYWLGWLGVAGIALVFGMISLLIADGADYPFSALKALPMRLFRLIASLAVLFPLAVVFVKRLHDREKSGYHAVLPIGLLAVSNVIEFVGPGGMPRTAALVAFIILTATLIVLGWYIIELGFLRGTRGPNRFGPDPLGGA